MEREKKVVISYSILKANLKKTPNFTLATNINMTSIFRETWITSKNCMDFSYVIYFNCNKKSHCITIYTKLKKNRNIFKT